MKLNIVEMMMIAANWLEKKMSLALCQYLNSMGVLIDPFNPAKFVFRIKDRIIFKLCPRSISHFITFVVFFPEAQCKLWLLQSAYHLRYSTPDNRINVVSHKRLCKVFSPI